jgi:hypothetical protein
MEIRRFKKMIAVTYYDASLDEVPAMDEHIRKTAAKFGGVIINEVDGEDTFAPIYEPKTEKFQSSRNVPLLFPSVAKAEECAAEFEDHNKFVYGAMIKCGKDGNAWRQATVICKRVLAGAPIGSTTARDESDPDNVVHAYICCKNCDKTHNVIVCSDCVIRRFGTHELAATA